MTVAVIGLVLWFVWVAIAIALGVAAKRGDQQAERFRRDEQP